MGTPNEDSPTIMVVDDYDGIRLLLKGQLEKRGYRVVEATDGGEAVETALGERHSLRLILMDINLPTMDGLSATRKIHEITELCDVPIVACTARSSPEEREKALKAGCTEVVAKPIDKAMIGALISKYFPEKLT